METISVRHYRSFTGLPEVPANGNPCKLLISSPLSDSRPPDIEDGLTTLCYTWPVGNASTYRVRCYQKLAPVQCCGHGLLAAARYWFETNNSNQLLLKMSESLIAGFREGQLIWLRFHRISCQSCAIPLWLDKVFDKPGVIDAALAGDEQGYLVLRWPNDFPLDSINAPPTDIERFTQRAIICTARQITKSTPVHFRYFAPQYGVVEDQATGSAMRILADYWRQRFNSFAALQVSREKGYFLARCEDSEFVEIGGYCVEVA